MDIDNNHFILVEKNRDLFNTPKTVSLCHCISKDYHLKTGIARSFKTKFGQVKELKGQNVPGDGLLFSITVAGSFTVWQQQKSIKTNLDSVT